MSRTWLRRDRLSSLHHETTQSRRAALTSRQRLRQSRDDTSTSSTSTPSGRARRRSCSHATARRHHRDRNTLSRTSRVVRGGLVAQQDPGCRGLTRRRLGPATPPSATVGGRGRAFGLGPRVRSARPDRTSRRLRTRYAHLFWPKLLRTLCILG
jgi:hypothetical protein